MSFRIIRSTMKIPIIQGSLSHTSNIYWSKNSSFSSTFTTFNKRNKTFSTSSISYNSEITINKWIKKLTDQPKKYNHDTIDIERISQLRRILPTRQSGNYLQDVKKGEELSPSHHLVLFRPKPMLRDLGLDGSSTEYNAPSPYTRRMWAGGSMTWSKSNKLKVGEDITQIVTVPKVDFKKDMIFVNQQLLIYSGIKPEIQGMDEEGEDDWAIKEIRTHVFRKQSAVVSSMKPIDTDVGLTTKKEQEEEKKPPNSEINSIQLQKNSVDKPPISFSYTPNSPLLFLYSALTHNPHKIHYDHPWTINKEGHSKPLVHGPLTATLLVELADQVGNVQGKQLKEFKYRATNPMMIDKEITMTSTWNEDKDNQGLLELIAAQSGKIGMKAAAEYY